MTRQSLESRRLLAEADLRAGMKQADVARKHGVSRQTTTRWARAIRQGKSLRSTRATGGYPPFVPREKIQALCEAVPLATGRELQDLIESVTGVRYDVDHVHRLRKRLREKEAVKA